MKGNILKLKTSHEDIVQYHLPIGDELVHLNPLVGKDIRLEFTGTINCIHTGKKVKKTYGQGYSIESYLTLARCDQCIFQPELCHFAQGTCREEDWGLANCFQPHIIYLANSSGLKVGITRKSQVPTRWMDQGASSAIKLCEVKDRRTSGLLEVELATVLNDRTNWRKMLKNEQEDIDLVAEREKVYNKFAAVLEKLEAKKCTDSPVHFNYPVEVYPTKVTAYNLKKQPLIEDKLMGIKGQYLIFEKGVLNIRKYQGYELELRP